MVKGISMIINGKIWLLTMVNDEWWMVNDGW